MRILVYGAGVLGCELAHVLLQNKKNDVTLLARGEWKERIDQKGLVIRQWAQRKTTVDRVRQSSRPTGAPTLYSLATTPMQSRFWKPCSAQPTRSPLASRTPQAAGSAIGWSVCTPVWA